MSMVPTAIELDKKLKLQGKDNEVLLSSLYHYPLYYLFTSVPIFDAAVGTTTRDYFQGVDDYPMCKHRWQISAIW